MSEGEGDYLDDDMEKTEGQTTEKLYGIDKILSSDGKDNELLDRYTHFTDVEIIYAIAEQRLVNKLIKAIIKKQEIKMEYFDEYYRDIERMLVSLHRGGRGDVKDILGVRHEIEEGEKRRNAIAHLFGMESSGQK